MSEDLSYLQRIEDAIRAAERHLGFDDVDPEDDDALNDMTDLIYHCNICTVREVMNIVWPPVQEYIDYLQSVQETTKQKDDK